MNAPPPRKKPKKGKDADDENGARSPKRGHESASEEVSSGRLAQTPDDDDPTKGEWLFKQNDMVLGPVTAMVLVDRIKQGELSADTPIARDGQPFKPMKLVGLFREAYEATLEKKRREQEEREHNAKVSRARVARVFIFATIVLVPAGAGAFAGRTVMQLQPWDDTPTWIAKSPPLVDLPPRPIEVKKEEPRVVAANDEPPATAEDDDNKGPARPGGKKRVADKRGGDDKKGDDKKGDDKKEPEEVKQTGPIPETLTNEQAIAPLKGASSSFKACFKAEMEANPDVPSPVILSYTVTEEGKAANVKLDNRELRGRPVVECVQKAMAGLRWPRFSGERKNVSVPFKLSKPSKPGEPPK